MTGLVRFMGWLAVAVGVISAVVPLVMPALLAPADAILIAFVGIFAGIGLVALAQLLGIVQRIEVNTNWFSVSTPGAARGDEPGAAQPDEPAPARPDKPAATARPVEAEEPDEPSTQTWQAPVEREMPTYTARDDDTRTFQRPYDQEPAARSDAPDDLEPGDSDAGERQPGASPTPPEIYDAERHPPAIEEWSYEGLRVMTLRDGSVAAEIDGMWYRFVEIQDLADFMQSGENT